MTKPSISTVCNQKVRPFQKHVFSKVRIFKNTYFQKSVFSKTRIFKSPYFQKHVFSKVRIFKSPYFQKIPCFFKTSVFLKNSPFESPSFLPKDGVFIRTRFFNKIRFVIINMWISLILYRTFVILCPT